MIILAIWRFKMKKKLSTVLLAAVFVFSPVYAAKPAAKAMSRDELGKVLTCQIKRSPKAIIQALKQHGREIDGEDYLFKDPLVVDGIDIYQAGMQISGEFVESLELFSRTNESKEQVRQKLKWGSKPKKSNSDQYDGQGRVANTAIQVYVPGGEKFTQIVCAREL